jgi:hypothetical protein
VTTGGEVTIARQAGELLAILVPDAAAARGGSALAGGQLIRLRR